MNNNNPIIPIGGILALIFLLSGLISQKSCDLGCNTTSEITTTRASRQFQELSKNEKRAAFEQLLNNPDTRHQMLSVLSNEDKFNQFLENIKSDPEAIEVLHELRQTHRYDFDFKAPNEEPVITIESGEVPKYKPAKFKKIQANVNEADTTQLLIEK